MKRLDWGHPNGPQDWEYVYRGLTEIRERSFVEDAADPDISTLQTAVDALEAVDITLDTRLDTLEAIITHGTFTPAITFGGLAVGVTYGLQEGNYTKIGTRVLYSLRVTLTSKGSSTGVVLITTLPFTAAAKSFAAGVYFNKTVFSAATQEDRYGLVLPSSATIALYANVNDGANGAAIQMDNTYFLNTSDIVLTGHYSV